MKYILSFIMLTIMILFANKALAEDLVSVKLKRNIDETKILNLQIKGGYFTLGTLELKQGVSYHLTVKKGTFKLKGKHDTQAIAGPLILIPNTYDHNHIIYINDKPYLGAMEFTIEKNMYIRPINQLPLEDYLKGVVPFEVYSSWGIETLKAQTLAARTYAASHVGQTIDDTISYQVYGGYLWHEKTTKAVEETRGEVITYNNQLIDAFYSASNGGITENNAHVWGGQSQSYYPIKTDPYDPVSDWQFTFYHTQIKIDDINWVDPSWWDNVSEKDKMITDSMKRWLARKGYSSDLKILSIDHFHISDQRNKAERAVSGSITINFLQRLFGGFVVFNQVTLDHVPIDNIRPIIGGTRFKSYLVDTFFDDGEIYYIKGRGFGHGVGMSQEGAHVMGDKGKSYKEILSFYFPGTQIIRLTTLKRWPRLSSI